MTGAEVFWLSVATGLVCAWVFEAQRILERIQAHIPDSSFQRELREVLPALRASLVGTQDRGAWVRFGVVTLGVVAVLVWIVL